MAAAPEDETIESVGETVVIIGGSRGIGLGIVKEYISKGYNVIATTRKPNDELNAIENVRVVENIDVTDETVGDKIIAALGDTKIDILIYNPGLLIMQNDPAVLDMDEARRTFEVNVWGVVKLVQALVANVNDGGKIVLMSSCAGSKTYHFNQMYPNVSAYTMSKAALNMYGSTLSVVVKERNIAVGMLHPGFVYTDMTMPFDFPVGRVLEIPTSGYSMPMITVNESAVGCVDSIEKLSMENSPWYFSYYGATYAW